MKLPKLIETLTRTPLLIRPETAESIGTLLEQHQVLTREAFLAKREGKDFCGENVDLEQMVVEKGLAMIPVKGPLGIGLSAFEKGAGATDYIDIQRELREANEHPNVDNILLVTDTPGGMFGGLQETADQIAASEKPVYLWVPPGGMVASAGMWLAASCAGRFLSKSASAGSIGVYCAWHDYSEAAAKRGVRVRVFSSGTYKGMGVPGTSLTPEQESHLQDQVLELAEEFYQHIRNNLGDIPNEAMQGQMFRSGNAVALGFADAVVSSLEEMQEFLG